MKRKGITKKPLYWPRTRIKCVNFTPIVWWQSITNQMPVWNSGFAPTSSSCLVQNHKTLNDDGKEDKLLLKEEVKIKVCFILGKMRIEKGKKNQLMVVFLYFSLKRRKFKKSLDQFSRSFSLSTTLFLLSPVSVFVYYFHLWNFNYYTSFFNCF